MDGGAVPPVNVPVLIPAFEPGDRLLELVEALAQSELPAIIVVNDGSGPAYQACFDALRLKPKVCLLEHAVNLGKGAALKTGINYALCGFPGLAGVVTADADGQHHPEDVLRVARRLAAQPGTLVMGVRRLGAGVPLRSRLGNAITSRVVRLLVGQRLADTQTGLRGIPQFLLPRLLRIPSTGYEFELDMLIAARHQSCPLAQEPIRTMYPDGVRTSHFNPLLDSLRIYFVLLRFATVSLLSAVLDNAVFTLAYALAPSILRAQVTGRLAAVAFNYLAARRAVFLSHQPHRATAPKYLALVLASGAVSYGLINFLSAELSLSVIAAKILAESLLFIANFAIQRDFVFKEPPSAGGGTDWNRYYTVVPLSARPARRYTARVLLKLAQRFAGREGKCGTIVELGGGNSCFLEGMIRRFHPRVCHVVDNNQYGLDLLRQRLGDASGVLYHNQDVRRLALDVQADLVFSVGLIEHFDVAGTREAIRAHFDLLKPGGWAILSFPTPTWPYRAARFLTESVGLWKFVDERPLSRQEVLATVNERGRAVYQKTLWPLVFTQRVVVAQKAEPEERCGTTGRPRLSESQPGPGRTLS